MASTAERTYQSLASGEKSFRQKNLISVFTLVQLRLNGYMKHGLCPHLKFIESPQLTGCSDLSHA